MAMPTGVQSKQIPFPRLALCQSALQIISVHVRAVAKQFPTVPRSSGDWRQTLATKPFSGFLNDRAKSGKQKKDDKERKVT
jgi:hypothetical protein